MRERRSHQRARAGFTLIELLVAIILIDVGVLALVAGSAIVVRRRNDVRARAAAARLADDRIQLLSATACAPAAGTSVAGTTREMWTVSLVPNNVREVRDSVAFDAGGVTRSVVLRTRVPC